MFWYIFPALNKRASLTYSARIDLLAYRLCAPATFIDKNELFSKLAIWIFNHNSMRVDVAKPSPVLVITRFYTFLQISL